MLGVNKSIQMPLVLSRKIRKELVTELMIIAREELEHLQMVHDLIKGLTLGRERRTIM
jgi:tRNA-(ms[2]io[6]A)-hydroxylase